jgi:hypothetical protein
MYLYLALIKFFRKLRPKLLHQIDPRAAKVDVDDVVEFEQQLASISSRDQCYEFKIIFGKNYLWKKIKFLLKLHLCYEFKIIFGKKYFVKKSAIFVQITARYVCVYARKWSQHLFSRKTPIFSKKWWNRYYVSTLKIVIITLAPELTPYPELSSGRSL